MAGDPNPPRSLVPLLVLAAFVAVATGTSVGIAIGGTVNTMNGENFIEFRTALPSRIYDIKGRLITEFYSDEKREIVHLNELPPHLVHAFIVREDRAFYRHRGFTLRSLARAVFGVLSRQNLGGGSTITQQVAGTLYADRRDISIRRKLVELWWALQLERRYTKDEILEIYLNTMVMGTGVYGVEAASKYFFGHSARELSLAEAAILVIQLSSPARYDPYRNPNAARSRSRGVLESMVAFRYATREDVDRSFDEFWDNFDYTRISAGAFLSRDDKAPWFSEYVRRQLEEMLYGSLDLYTDGFSVYTTLDLDKQALADSYMAGGLAQANAQYKRASSQRLGEAERTFIPILEMLGLAFNQESFRASDSRTEFAAQEMYRDRINPLLDATALLFGIPDLKSLTNAGFGRLKTELERTVVEGALVTIENETGHITSMVGGSRFDQSNQLIRATQARLMPGSTFKPLYYSAALDSGRFTQASLLYDAPVVFYTADGNPYMPLNFKGEWKGPVLLWQALARSMNIPSLKVLDAIGFDAAIARAASLLDITDPAEIRSTFPRVYPLGLGVIGTTPLRMARAFSVFANGGSAVTPIAIRSVEDRTGAVILEPEKDLRRRQAQNAERNRVVSPVNAALMVDMLERVVKSGTLAGQTSAGTSFRQQNTDGSSYIIPAGGKTGTTDNWADAWTVGFTPYLTTAIWFGFDRPGNSLGVEQTGALLAGTVWANYMRDIHRGMSPKEFPKPLTGLATMQVCAKSGQMLTPHCDEGSVTLLFAEGTQPIEPCTMHTAASDASRQFLQNILDQIEGGQSRPEVPGLEGDRDPDPTITLPSLPVSPPDSTIDLEFPDL